MSDISAYLLSPASIVHLATLCYVMGLLTRNELVLRFFILTGTAFYILYYYHIAEQPLWEAIFTSLLIGSANLPVIWRIFRERSTLGMSDEMLSLYQSFPNFNPGQFRTLMRMAEIVKDCPETMLLEEGKVPGKLYLSVSEGFVVMRGTQHATISPGNFLGEISFLLSGPATADVCAYQGSTYVVWQTEALRQLMARDPAMASAITVLLNKDIARKLAGSFPSRATSVLPVNVT
ncbi:cyclic nucleotide-binding domain-containing protein [Sulfitobacter sp. M57]|nr:MULTISPECIES: cyclic nucleotide-binding domain-containing protein [unclassified Sulfitobacter]MDF3461574.1 cyclic nucleotide-binding domain-containing protein [Sulfitobacter sp. Ks18]MDF3477021.1 cyclic nucleotide-binding domain-containing protein [Sulfitobacter sp. M53]MDF3480919.1 cyclic nucleotide-binding domain-containing protein [Sulfitobacter sp. M24]MDF3484816.1 cyclic nucleotide-binding domain-containing protein [Sulfitobacter sp. Ks13]MDF3508232.1 cyclic nucleotide-binding domain-c